MSDLAHHVVLRADLFPHLIYEAPGARDDPRQAPREVASHVEPVLGHDEPGTGITLARAAPWRCLCGRDLALDYRDVPSAWAAHVAGATGLPAGRLEAHMLVEVAGQHPVGRCACEARFQAPPDDPLNGDAVVARWAEHVEGLDS
jgi:hypothetical protein